MNLYIPQIGDKIKLSKNWSFSLLIHDKNDSLLEAYGLFKQGIFPSWEKKPNLIKNQSVLVNIPQGSVLQIEKVYIRKDRVTSDNIQFSVLSSPDNSIENTNFFAFISDVNKIHCEIKK